MNNFDKEALLEQFRAERAELEADIEERLRNRVEYDPPIDEVKAWRERREQWARDRSAEGREREIARAREKEREREHRGEAPRDRRQTPGGCYLHSARFRLDRDPE
jgi:hypothetical protein